MTIDRITTDQLEHDAALDEIAPSANTGLDTTFPNINSRVKKPGRLSVTGSSLVLTVGSTIVTTGPSGKKLGLSQLSNIDLGSLSGTFDFATGTGTGDVQNTSLPNMSAGYFVRAGVEIRTDKKIYVIFGAQASTSGAATAPQFSKTSVQKGEILLQDNGTAGFGNFSNPAMSAITEFDSSGGGAGSSADLPLKIFAAEPTPDSKLYFNAARVQQGDGAFLAAPVINATTPNFVASSIDFQTGVTSGGTFDFTPPASTVGRYRLCVFSLMVNDILKCIFSSEQTSIGSLPDPGTLYDGTGVDVGYVILECTNASGQFKTAGSSSNVIENSVGGAARVVREVLSPPRSVSVDNYDNIITDDVTGEVIVDDVTGNVITDA